MIIKSKYVVNISATCIITTLLLVSGCNNINSDYEDSYFTKKSYQNRLTRWLKPYKIDIQQGNLITSDMLNEIKIGMNKQQVKHILGTSILTDNDTQDQWIYAFTHATNGKVDKEQVLILSFKDSRLDDIKENTVVN